jgi:EAL domain-containing protein (putative c-di-GMP-specific phosphodiesterase class I)
MLDRADCATILSAVVALGRDLKTETVAEGVETEQQFNALCAAGVTLVQGYLFGVHARHRILCWIVPQLI